MITSLTIEDAPAIGSFLRTVFPAPENERLFGNEALQWKAFYPHPWHAASRSYGFKEKEAVVAHGLIVPLRFQTSSEEFRSHCIIDWASSMQGGGILVYRELAKLVDFQLGIGGSSIARALLPRMGFRVHVNLTFYSRIQQPLRFHSSGRLDWKTPLRIARDYARNLCRKPLTRWSLTAHAVEQFAESVPMPSAAIARATVSMRSAALLNYLLKCPLARMEGYRIDRAGQPYGYCLLARIGSECRVADLWIDAGEGSEWREAVSLATHLAGPKSRVITAAASTGLERAAWVDCGYSKTQEVPVHVHDRAGLLPKGELRVGLIDDDGFYL